MNAEDDNAHEQRVRCRYWGGGDPTDVFALPNAVKAEVLLATRLASFGCELPWGIRILRSLLPEHVVEQIKEYCCVQAHIETSLSHVRSWSTMSQDWNSSSAPTIPPIESPELMEMWFNDLQVQLHA